MKKKLEFIIAESKSLLVNNRLTISIVLAIIILVSGLYFQILPAIADSVNEEFSKLEDNTESQVETGKDEFKNSENTYINGNEENNNLVETENIDTSEKDDNKDENIENVTKDNVDETVTESDKTDSMTTGNNTDSTIDDNNADEKELEDEIANEDEKSTENQDNILEPKSFDLSLKKFITKVNDQTLVDENKREPVVDVSNLKNGNSTDATYITNREPISVNIGDILTYTIRIYNEGELSGYAEEVTDYLPEGLGYLVNYKDNDWNFSDEPVKLNTILSEDLDFLAVEDFKNLTTLQDVEVITGKTKLTSTKLSEELIEGFSKQEMQTLAYKDIQITCIVLVENIENNLINIGEISAILDENKNEIEDVDSIPNNVNIMNYTEVQQDDDDYEEVIGSNVMALDENYPCLDNTISPNNTVINLFDYWITDRNNNDFVRDSTINLNQGINHNNVTNNRHTLLFHKDRINNEPWNSWTGSWNNANYGLNNPLGRSALMQGLVEPMLENGYPVLKSDFNVLGNNYINSWDIGANASLNYLFNPTIVNPNQDGKVAYTNVGKLFHLDSNNYYYYNSSENYAYYNEDRNEFIVYNEPAIRHAASSTNGNFFPFNTMEEAKTLNTPESSALNHYFGMTVTSRFIQRYDGYADANRMQKTTFEFAGDDDVWIFIDNVLVADLGGIHDKASVVIDFVTGKVTINSTNASASNTYSTTLYSAFSNAGAEDTVDWNENNTTFENNTTHVLKFFYLERGNAASNLYLKFNLTDIPKSSIYKIDQYGERLQGAKFALYKATYDEANDNYLYIADNNAVYVLPENYNVNEVTGVITFIDNGNTVTITPKYIDETKQEGTMTFVDEYETPLSIGEIQDILGNHFILREVKVPNGYRTASKESFLRIDDNVIVCDNTFQSGVWASNNAMVTATNTLYNANDITDVINYYTPAGITNNEFPIVNGMLFAVILTRSGEDSNGNERSSALTAEAITNDWFPVYGSDEAGYSIMNESGISAAIKAARKNSSNYGQNNIFYQSTNGMSVEIENMPGRINSYYTYMNDKGVLPTETPPIGSNPQYIVAYYWTSANSLDNATAENTVRVTSHSGATDIDFDGFEILWGTTIEITNFENRAYFQKVDTDEKIINGSRFAMYNVNQDENNNMYYITQDNVNIYLSNDSGYNSGIASLNYGSNEGTYKIDSFTGVITVNIGGTTYLINPAVNADGHNLVEITTQDNDYGNDAGCGSFNKLNYGRYIMREIYAPNGYLLNTNEIRILVNDDDVYIDAGTSGDGIIVGNGLGYLASTLNMFATEGTIDESLTWIYFILGYLPTETTFNQLDDITYENTNLKYLLPKGTYVENTAGDGISTVFNLVANGNTTSNISEAMVTYLKYDNTGANVRFDYGVNTNLGGQNPRISKTNFDGNSTIQGIGTERLFSDIGWTSIFAYQDYIRGSDKTRKFTYYENLTKFGNIANLFSRSTLVRVTDEIVTDVKVKKIVGGSNESLILKDAEFVLYKYDENNEKLYYKYDNGVLEWCLPNNSQVENFKLITDENGLLMLKDLKDGVYYLEEIKAPECFVRLDEPIEITVNHHQVNPIDIDEISSSKGVERVYNQEYNNQTETAKYILKVPNNTGFRLPDTGGQCNGDYYTTTGLLLMFLMSIAVCYKKIKFI